VLVPGSLTVHPAYRTNWVSILDAINQAASFTKLEPEPDNLAIHTPTDLTGLDFTSADCSACFEFDLVAIDSGAASLSVLTSQLPKVRVVTVRIIWRVLFTLSGGLADHLFEVPAGTNPPGLQRCNSMSWIPPDKSNRTRHLIRTKPAI